MDTAMGIRKLLMLAITVIAVMTVAAHPKRSDAQMIEYGQHVQHTTREIGRCLEASPELKVRMTEWQDATLVHLRKARSINVPKGLASRTIKPNKEALLEWSKKSHGRVGQSQDPQDLFKFKWELQNSLVANPAGCALAPETIYGPYWLEGQPLKQDITSGKPGIPVRIAMQIIDVNNCKPIWNARVDTWQANAIGQYDPDPNGALRGWQPTSNHGTVDFDSIFPGHYPGRATHIHVAVRPNDGQHTAHVGMVYYDQGLRDFIETTSEYVKNPDKNPMSNVDDVFAQYSASTQYDPFMQYSWLGGKPEDGLLTWIVIGVNDSDATIEQAPKPTGSRDLFEAHLKY